MFAIAILLQTVSWNGTERNGTERNGTERNGTERNGTERNGTERNGTERNGTERNGTERNGTERIDPIIDEEKNEEGTKRCNVIFFESMSLLVLIKECMQTSLISSAFSTLPCNLFVSLSNRTDSIRDWDWRGSRDRTACQQVIASTHLVVLREIHAWHHLTPRHHHHPADVGDGDTTAGEDVILRMGDGVLKTGAVSPLGTCHIIVVCILVHCLHILNMNA